MSEESAADGRVEFAVTRPAPEETYPMRGATRTITVRDGSGNSTSVNLNLEFTY